MGPPQAFPLGTQSSAPLPMRIGQGSPGPQTCGDHSAAAWDSIQGQHPGRAQASCRLHCWTTGSQCLLVFWTQMAAGAITSKRGMRGQRQATAGVGQLGPYCCTWNHRVRALCLACFQVIRVPARTSSSFRLISESRSIVHNTSSVRCTDRLYKHHTSPVLQVLCVGELATRLC